jgi:hypothetical protein
MRISLFGPQFGLYASSQGCETSKRTIADARLRGLSGVFSCDGWMDEDEWVWISWTDWWLNWRGDGTFHKGAAERTMGTEIMKRLRPLNNSPASSRDGEFKGRGGEFMGRGGAEGAEGGYSWAERRDYTYATIVRFFCAFHVDFLFSHGQGEMALCASLHRPDAFSHNRMPFRKIGVTECYVLGFFSETLRIRLVAAAPSHLSWCFDKRLTKFLYNLALFICIYFFINCLSSTIFMKPPNR